jgi:hypothetical protein
MLLKFKSFFSFIFVFNFYFNAYLYNKVSVVLLVHTPPVRCCYVFAPANSIWAGAKVQILAWHFRLKVFNVQYMRPIHLWRSRITTGLSYCVITKILTRNYGWPRWISCTNVNWHEAKVLCFVIMTSHLCIYSSAKSIFSVKCHFNICLYCICIYKSLNIKVLLAYW